MSQGSRLLVIAALSLSILVIGIGIGGTIPWIALSLDARGTSPFMIGVISAAQPLGIMIMAPFCFHVARRFGLARSVLIFDLLALPPVALLAVFEHELAWFILRFVGGMAMAVPWVLGETWVNLVSKPAWRARSMGVYGAGVAAGFALGPIVLTLVPVGATSAIWIFVGVSLIAIAPLLLIQRFSVTLDEERAPAFIALIFAMPVVFMAVAMAAAADMSFATFLPIWGLSLGYSHTLALLLVTIVIVGNVVLQFPIGMLADRIGIRQTITLCAWVSLAGPLVIIAFAASLPVVAVTLFIWGGAVWALYSLALAEIGHRLRGSAVAAANGAMVFVYTLANVIGPPLAGFGLETFKPHGFMGLALLFALALLVLIYVRGDPDARRSSE